MSYPNYITPQGFSKLQEEFKELYYGERPKLVETIAWAASNGDRRENGDYIYGKRRLRQIDSKLRFLRDHIEKAQIIDPKQISSDKIVFGATVTIEDEQGETKTYQIVGEDEVAAKDNRVSWRSPLGQALLGRLEGDEIQIQRPRGTLQAEILKIEYK